MASTGLAIERDTIMGTETANWKMNSALWPGRNPTIKFLLAIYDLARCSACLVLNHRTNHEQRWRRSHPRIEALVTHYSSELEASIRLQTSVMFGDSR